LVDRLSSHYRGVFAVRIAVLLTESSMSVRIIVADDDAVVRQGTRRILETRPEWEICGEAEKPTYAY
jgi:hypothetical protein